MDFNVAWYLLVGILLIGYAILDGFDLGVGILHLFAKGDHQRRISMNSIGPVWDGNEVWLITAGGALFAAFPHVYATAFSAFYLPFFLLLAALIFRAVSMEFRSKEPGKRWRNFWDWMFFLGSFLSALLFGVAIGNAVMGLAIGADKEFQGGILELLNPYALTVGLFTVLLFALHGAMFLIVKTEGQQQKQIQKISKVLFIAFLVAYFLVTGLTLYLKPEMVANFSFGKVSLPGGSHELVTSYQTTISIVTWILVVANFLAILNISRALWKGKEMLGFLSSSANIAALVSLFALGIFPNMLVSTLNPDWNLTIYNASSSDYTLRTMFFLALIGMPFVIAYTSIIYWTYRGKTELTDSSY